MKYTVTAITALPYPPYALFCQVFSERGNAYFKTKRAAQALAKKHELATGNKTKIMKLGN
jgi:hypothetical protein